MRAAARKFEGEQAGKTLREVGGKRKRDVEAKGLGGPLGGHVGVVSGAEAGWGVWGGLGGAPG